MSPHLDEMLKAAGEPTRLRILHLLQHGALCVSDLQAALALPQSSVSRHLATLRHTGLVTPTRLGTRTVYSIATERNAPLEALRGLLARGCCGEESLQADLLRLEQVVKKRSNPCARNQ
jgi:ArsR family transcriptional regulator